MIINGEPNKIALDRLSTALLNNNIDTFIFYNGIFTIKLPNNQTWSMSEDEIIAFMFDKTIDDIIKWRIAESYEGIK